MKKILVAEDNEMNMKLFFDILKYQNYDVVKSTDGFDAYNKIKSDFYDLIILDIKLPKLDGFELLQKLKDENAKIPPVIIASACAMDGDKLRAQKYNVASYITKPIDINNFISSVKAVLD